MGPQPLLCGPLWGLWPIQNQTVREARWCASTHAAQLAVELCVHAHVCRPATCVSWAAHASPLLTRPGSPLSPQPGHQATKIEPRLCKVFSKSQVSISKTRPQVVILPPHWRDLIGKGNLIVLYPACNLPESLKKLLSVIFQGTGERKNVLCRRIVLTIFHLESLF